MGTSTAVDRSAPVFSDYSAETTINEDAVMNADCGSGARGAVTGMLLGAALWCGILMLAGVVKL